MKKRVILEGIMYDSIAEASAHYGIPRTTVQGRLKRGYTLLEAFGIKQKETTFIPISVPAKEYTYDDQTFPSRAALCRYLGIDPALVAQRINRDGWTENEALGIALHPKHEQIGVETEIDGVHYQNIKQLAEIFHIKRATIQSRLKRGWSPKQAVEIESPPIEWGNCAPIEIVGKIYQSKHKAATEFSIRPNTVKRRLLAGWSIEQAYGLEDNPDKLGPIRTEVNGTKYPSIKAAAEGEGVPIKRVMNRLERGWSTKEAFGTLDDYFANKYGSGFNGYKSDGLIYLITSLKNGRQYIGLTQQSLTERFKGHVDQAAKPERCPKDSLQEAINLYGKENFSIEEIDKAEIGEELSELERSYIDLFKTYHPFGYNLAPGGSRGVRGSRETEFRGKIYPSIKAAARILSEELGIGISAACKRINDRNYHKRDTSIVVAGIKYKSFADAGRKLGVSGSTAWKRMNGNSDWSLEEAFNLIPRFTVPCGKPLELEGSYYRSITEAALAYGVDLGATYSKLHNSYLVESAFGIKNIPYGKQQLYIRGRFYQSLPQFLEAHGFDLSLVNTELTPGSIKKIIRKVFP